MVVATLTVSIDLGSGYFSRITLINLLSLSSDVGLRVSAGR